jgi:integrase
MPITKLQKKRDGLQGYRVRVNYTDPDTGAYRRIERIVYGKAEAADMERQLSAEAKSPAPTADDRLTVAEFIPQFLSYKSNEVRKSSLTSHGARLRNHALPFFGPLRMCAVTPRHVADWVAALHGKGLAPNTISEVYTITKSMFARAVELRIITESPFGRLRRQRKAMPDAPKHDLQYYTAEQFQRFYASAAAAVSAAQNPIHERQHMMFFVLAFYTGMRPGEVLALHWTDIDFPARLIRIRRTYSKRFREGPVKTESSVRDVGIPSPLFDELQAHLRAQRSMPGFSQDFLVCGGPSHLSADAVRKRNSSYAVDAGLPQIRLHDFRHSHASLLVNHGINIQEVARRLGHSNVQVTWSTYAHLYPREEERALTVLDAVPLPPPNTP